jgi:Fe2+ transport system protein B
MKQEMGSWKWFISSFLFMIAVSFFGGVAAYHVARALGMG